MHKLKLFFGLSIICVAMLTGCQQSANGRLDEKSDQQSIPSSMDNVSIKMKKSIYSVSSDHIGVTIKNNSNEVIIANNQAHFEQNIKGTWYNVPLEEPKKQTAEGHILPPKSSNDQQYSFKYVTTSLTAGKYRVVFSYAYDNKKYKVAAPFKLVK
ncbi:immunoglobulin-like domain-containing protein [Priestia koreensis]|uniref:immunoglobulin-like domain-containing protein n=1 Tax=Priestia koreensis TaxID=284581 RepID=UPI001F593240|nr:immunoglobulin-like domain-containing protein [Priestia koreensis]UNL87474.1 hypothetical protein IE339_24465 [Priestia koreensis]